VEVFFSRRPGKSCTRLTTMSGSGGTYTELITCLEMKRDSSKLPKDGAAWAPITR
jgi:hypothetical protein